MWHLFQAIFVVEQDYFKILPQADALSLIEVIKTLYGPNLPQELSSDMEMAVDELLVVEEALFTIVTNKKSKGKKRPFFSTNTPVSSKNVPSLTTVVSRALSSSQPAKTATAKSIPVKVARINEIKERAYIEVDESKKDLNVHLVFQGWLFVDSSNLNRVHRNLIL